MYAESFHRALQIVYLDSKQNCHVDCLLAVLLRITRDKAFKQIQKLEKGNLSHQIKEINKRQASAKEMMSSGILPLQQSESNWQVKKKDHYYIVAQGDKERTCLLCCASCHACIHMYSCSCADAHLHNTVCKHAHIVQTTLINSSSDLPSGTPAKDVSITDNQALVINQDKELYEDLVFLANDDLPTADVEESSPDSADYFARILQSSYSITNLDKKKSLLKTKVNGLLMLVDNANNPDGITTVTQHVVTGIHSFIAMMSPRPDKTNSPINKRPASNANHEKQERFFSTKKKVTFKRWAKPKRLLAMRHLKVLNLYIVETVLKKMIVTLLILLNGFSAVNVVFGYMKHVVVVFLRKLIVYVKIAFVKGQ